MIANSNSTDGKYRAPRVMAAATILSLAFAALAQAEEYTVDPVHSRIAFSVTHLAISTVSGRFTNYTARIVMDKDAMASTSASADIHVASIDTSVEKRDEHLRSGDFFDAAKFPDIRFEADKAEKEGTGWVLIGKFTMRGVTRPMRLPVTIAGPVKDPWGNQRIGLQAKMAINRHDYGVGSDKAVDKAVGEDVTLEIALEAVAKK